MVTAVSTTTSTSIVATATPMPRQSILSGKCLYTSWIWARERLWRMF